MKRCDARRYSKGDSQKKHFFHFRILHRGGWMASLSARRSEKLHHPGKGGKEEGRRTCGPWRPSQRNASAQKP